jgi:putative Mg2+ transporter-C (MgtC) family protein
MANPSCGGLEIECRVYGAKQKQWLPMFRAAASVEQSDFPGEVFILSINYTEEFQILLQALVAVVLGGILGWEREAAGKWAGFRTYMLVCLAAMLFVRLGLTLIGDAAARFPSGALRADPTRTIEALAVGISFIGAGTIFRDRSGTGMKGLTTAAGLLAAASVGLAVAINRYLIACGITLICLFILRTLGTVEKRKLNPQRKRD